MTDTMEGAISHWFGAFRVDAFRDVAAVQSRYGPTNSRTSKTAQKVPGQDRIYVAGEIEHEKTLATASTAFRCT